MLLQLIEIEEQNECIHNRAQKNSYFLPEGFLLSVLEIKENILQLKAAVMNEVFIPAAYPQSR